MAEDLVVSPNGLPPVVWLHERRNGHDDGPFAGDTVENSPVAAQWQTPRVTVVIPTLNEARNLPHVLPLIPTWVHEVIIVDGLSTDGTIETARSLWPTCRIVTQSERGKGAALRAGFRAATGDIIVMLDADGSTNPSEIPAFVGALLAGSDFAKGSRFAQGGGTADISGTRQLGNWFFTSLARALFGGKYSDLCYGYNAFWTHVLPQLALSGNGFEIETEMNLRALQANLKIVEIPSFEHERIHGASNLRAIPDGWRVLKIIWREWRAKTKCEGRSTVPAYLGTTLTTPR